MALSFEFTLYRHVGQSLFLDGCELHHFGLGSRLEVFELLAGLRGGLLPAFEVGALGRDVLHHGVEVVEFDRRSASGDRCLTVGGDAGVGLIEVDQQRHRRTGVDETALGVLLQARSHRVGLCLDACQLLLGGADVDFEGVETGLRVEHRLRRCVGAIACGLDLVGGADGGGVLGARDGERQRRGADGNRGHDGHQGDRAA